jgi:hypothetical protein
MLIKEPDMIRGKQFDVFRKNKFQWFLNNELFMRKVNLMLYNDLSTLYPPVWWLSSIKSTHYKTWADVID